MRFPAVLFATVVGCGQIPEQAIDGSHCPVLSDMAAIALKCAAAKGLPGVPLICVDFPSAQTLVDLRGMGWDFTSQCPAGWTVANSNLQVNRFSTFIGSCIFTARPLTTIEYQQYSSFTLSVVQTVDLNTPKQTSWIYLGSDVVAQQIATSTGTNPQQRNTYEIAKTALPNGGNNSYQPLFKISSGTTVGMANMGWQIESIAVLGNP